jgi:hypothetical protein
VNGGNNENYGNLNEEGRWLIFSDGVKAGN